MKSNRSRLALIGTLTVVFSVTAGLAFGTVADAKKKKKKKSTPVSSTVTISKTSPTTLPPGTAAQPVGCSATVAPICTSGAKSSSTAIPLTVSNQGSNTVSPGSFSVSYTLTGSPRTGAGTAANTPAAASQVFLKVTAPSGRTLFLNDPGFLDQNATTIGPVTESSNSPFGVCGTTTVGANGTQTICNPTFADDPDDTVGPPTYAGTIGNSALEHLDGVPANGTWTFKAVNTSTLTATTTGTPATLSSISATFTTQGGLTMKKKKKKKK